MHAVKENVALSLVSWNANSYTKRKVDGEPPFANEEIDVFFVCKTFQSRYESGIIPALQFSRSVIFMHARKKSNEAGGRCELRS